MMRKSLIIGALIGSSLVLGGCYQNVGVSLHEPGEYKGSKDPLLTKLKSPEWQHKLNERFKLSQTDR